MKKRMRRRKEVEPMSLSAEIVDGQPVITTPVILPPKIKKKTGTPKITLANFSQAKINEIFRLARLGMSYRSIVSAVGTTLVKLDELRRESNTFSERLDAEREGFIADNLIKLRNHSESSPQSAQWLLERVRPDEFSQKAELRISGGTTNTMTLDVNQALCQRLAEARSAVIDLPPLSIDTTTSANLLPTNDIPHDECLGNQILDRVEPNSQALTPT